MSLPFLHSTADIIRRLLVNLGYGSFPTNPVGTWPIYAGEEPFSPDDCITVYDTQGKDEGSIQIDGERQHNPGIQVRVRSYAYDVGLEKISALTHALDEVILNNTVAIAAGSTIGAATYLVEEVDRTSSIAALGTESPTSKRLLFTVNGVVVIKRTS